MARTDVRFERAELRHVHLVARAIRPSDAAEVLASGGYRPAQALRACLRLTAQSGGVARTLFIDGQAAAMFGVVAGHPYSWPWAVTTDVVDRHPRAFWKASKVAVAALREVFPAMVQAVDARYEQALRWVERMGFQVDEQPQPFGFGQRPFHRITMGVTNV